jgi:hypothetical protein
MLDVPLTNKARQNTAECLNGQSYCFSGLRAGQVCAHVATFLHFGVLDQIGTL